MHSVVLLWLECVEFITPYSEVRVGGHFLVVSPSEARVVAGWLITLCFTGRVNLEFNVVFVELD